MLNLIPFSNSKNQLQAFGLERGIYYTPYSLHGAISVNYVSVLVACYWFPISIIALFPTTLKACLLPAQGGVNG